MSIIKKSSDYLKMIMDRRRTGLARSGFISGIDDFDNILWFRKQILAIVTGHSSTGKALDIYTHIPTSTGFKFMYEIKVGDKVFNENGQLCNVVACTDIQYGRPCYEIEFSSGEKIVCDEDHRWFTNTVASRMSAKNAAKRAGQPLKPKGTDQSHKRILPSVKTTKEIFDTLSAKDGKNNHTIENCKPCNGIHKNLIIEPYTLGVWLGDGRTDYASIYCEEPEMLARIQSEGYTTREQAVPHHHGIIKGFVGKLRELGVLHNKHIPNDYLFASYEQKLALLQGLMDSDGYCATSGNCEYCTTRKELGEQVLDLINSMGFKAVLHEGRAKLYGKDCGPKYRIIFTPNGTQVFHLKRKQERVKTNNYTGHRTIKSCKQVKSRAVKCIQVDSSSHLYLCTRSYIPTHNSEFVDQLCMNWAILHNYKIRLFSPENNPPESHWIKHIERFTGKPLRLITDKELKEANDFLDEYFAAIELSENEVASIDLLLKVAGEEYEKNKYDILVLDPWNECDFELADREDLSISRKLSQIKKFIKPRDMSCIIVAHPRTPRDKVTDAKGRQDYPPPKLHEISGGGNWKNKCEIGISCHRHPEDNELRIQIQKRKDKSYGDIGEIYLDYEYQTGRFKGKNEKEYLLPNVCESPF